MFTNRGKSRSESQDRRRSRPCNAFTDETGTCGESETLKILDEFYDLYKQRLHKCGERSADVTAQTFQDWVNDLTEQNRLLICTVEELEREAISRIREFEKIKSAYKSSQDAESFEKNKRICRLEKDLKDCSQCLAQKDIEIDNLNLKLKSRKTMDSRNPEETVEQKNLEEEIQYLVHVISMKDHSIKEYERQIEDLHSKLSVSQGQTMSSLTSLEDSNSMLKREISDLQVELGKKNKELECALKEIGSLKECLESNHQECSKENMVDKSLMAEDYNEDQNNKQLEELFNRDQELEILRERLETEKTNSETRLEELTLKLIEQQKASRDVQSALSAEVADKHDAIVALRREVSQMEEQLRKSDMQTHFKDDIIKQLRKEVKVAKAKDSLCEMLGLKVPPRTVTRCEIERMSAELEEREAALRKMEETLEARTPPRLEAAASELKDKLEKSERSVIALCDRIAYVRTYLKRLKDDEQLSVKCGLEALIHELNEDLEWNRETRRSVSSIDEGVANPESVIIINRVPSRSLSLPDSSLQKHEWSFKSWVENSAGKNVYGPLQVVRSVQEPPKRNGLDSEEIHQLEELIKNHMESTNNLSTMWQNIKQFAVEMASISTYNDLEQIKEEAKLNNGKLSNVMSDIEDVINNRSENVIPKDIQLLGCLEDNLKHSLHLLISSNQLSKDHPDFSLSHDEINPFKMSVNIKALIEDSLCLIAEFRNTLMLENDLSLKRLLRELQTSLVNLMTDKESIIQQLTSIQKRQRESYCEISKKFTEFDKFVAGHCQRKDELVTFMKKHILSQKGGRIGQGESFIEEKKKSSDSSFEIHKKSSFSSDSKFPEALKQFEDETRLLVRILEEIKKELDGTYAKLFGREEKLLELEREMYSLTKTLQIGQIDLASMAETLKNPEKNNLTSVAITKLGNDLAQFHLKLSNFKNIVDHYLEGKEPIDHLRIDSEKSLSNLEVKLPNLIKNIRNALDVFMKHLNSETSGYNSSKSSWNFDMVLLKNLESQLQFCKDQIQRFGTSLAKVSSSSEISCGSLGSVEPLNQAQTQLIGIQKEIQQTLEDAVKICRSEIIEDEISRKQNLEEMTQLKNSLFDLERNVESRERVVHSIINKKSTRNYSTTSRWASKSERRDKGTGLPTS